MTNTETNKPEKYYYTRFVSKCLEPCNLKKGVKIGSCTCSRCENCLESNTLDCYIICSKIKKATKVNYLKKIWSLIKD